MSNIESLWSILQPFAGIIDSERLDDLRIMLTELQTSLAAAREEGRNLRVAVVGQMKAGKSSFLNAAFFNRDLLPKADTPMTAALTKIVYASKARAEVVFYSQEDWCSIEQRAKEYAVRYAEIETRLIEESKTSPFAKARQPSKNEIESSISATLKASVDLVNKAKEHKLDVRTYLGTTKVLEDIDGAKNLAQALHDYVGAGGRFTAITKMSVLHVDDPRFEGLEIIDTPGFNDPVVSRGQVTRQYLGQCDVIFLLSALSQFITQADMSVMREQLPEAGINEKAIFLIGSQRDIALRQDPNIAKTAAKMAETIPAAQRDGAKVAAMMQLLDKKMKEHARSTLDAQISQPGLDEKTKRILGAINQNTPSFISAWSWLVAENFKSLSGNDCDQFNKLCRDTGYAFDVAGLRHLSNIPAVRDQVLKQREQKLQRLASKEKDLMDGVRQSAAQRLKEMLKSLTQRGERIRNGNIAALQKSEQDMAQRLAAGSIGLEDVFDVQLVKVKQQFALLKTKVREQAVKYSRIETVRTSESESYRVDTSIFNGFFGHDWETRHRTVVTVYASAQDAIEKLQEFTIKTTKILQKEIMECVNLELLRRNVEQATMALFDTGSAGFDCDLMLKVVKKSLRRVTIPDVDFGNKDYTQVIMKAFGNDRVSESNIDGLKQAQHEAVTAIIVDLESEVNSKLKSISNSLDSTCKTFVADMSRDIKVSLTQLREDIANKEKIIKEIGQAQIAVEKCLTDL